MTDHIFVLITSTHGSRRYYAADSGSGCLLFKGGKLGTLEELIVEPEDHRLTHIVLREGLLFKERKLVPVTWIDRIEEEEVRFSVSSGTLDKLPEYQNQD